MHFSTMLLYDAFFYFEYIFTVLVDFSGKLDYTYFPVITKNKARYSNTSPFKYI